MVSLKVAVLYFGFLSVGLVSPAEFVSFGQAPTPAPNVSASACTPGYAEIVAKHFRVTNDPHSELLRQGTLTVTARRGWVEEKESKPISYRADTGMLVPGITAPIVNGALEHPVCVPFTSVYGTRAMRYQMTVTDDDGTPRVLLVVTADLNDPQYALDDNGLYRVEPGDEDPVAANASAGPGEPPPDSCRIKPNFIAKLCGRE